MPPPIEEQHAIASNGVERRALVVVPGEAAGDVDDMITIDNLTIETILSNLVGRYARDQIYVSPAAALSLCLLVLIPLPTLRLISDLPYW